MGNKAHIKIDEEKQLLLKELFTRLPYHVKVKVWLEDGDTEEGPLDLQHNYGDVLLDAFYYKKITKIKPYLRPMSSMTEEERLELSRLTNDKFKFYLYTKQSEIICYEKYNYLEGLKVLDWLNTHHFDYRGLIEKGLALEAPKGMYETKTE